MSLENGNTETKPKRKAVIKKMNAVLKTYSEKTTAADENYKNVDQDESYQIDDFNVDEYTELIHNAPGTTLYRDIKYAVFSDILNVRGTLLSYIIVSTWKNTNHQTYLTLYSDTSVLAHQLVNDAMSIIDVRRNLQRLQSELNHFRSEYGLLTTDTERNTAVASKHILSIIKSHQDDIDPDIINEAKRLKNYVLPQNMGSSLNDIIDKLLTELSDYDAVRDEFIQQTLNQFINLYLNCEHPSEQSYMAKSIQNNNSSTLHAIYNYEVSHNKPKAIVNDMIELIRSSLKVSNIVPAFEPEGAASIGAQLRAYILSERDPLDILLTMERTLDIYTNQDPTHHSDLMNQQLFAQYATNLELKTIFERHPHESPGVILDLILSLIESSHQQLQRVQHPEHQTDSLDRATEQALFKELEENRLKLIEYNNLLDDMSDELELVRTEAEQNAPVAYSAEDKPNDPAIKAIVNDYKHTRDVLEEMVGRTFKLAPRHTRTPQYYRETGMTATLFGSIAMIFGGIAMSGTIMVLGAALFALAIAATDRAASLSAIEAGHAKRKNVEGQDKAQDAIEAPAEALPETTQTIDKFLDSIHHSQIDKLKDIYLSEDNVPYYGYMLLDRSAFIEYYQIDIPDENLVGMTHESKVQDASMIEAISRYKEARPATDDMVLGAIKDIKSSHMYEKELKTDALTKSLIDNAPNLERSPYHASMQQFAEQVKNNSINNEEQNQSQKNSESSARQNDVW